MAKMTISDEMKVKLRAAMHEELDVILDEDIGNVVECCIDSFREHNGEKQFEYPVSLTFRLIPSGSDMKIISTIKASRPAFKGSTLGRIITPEKDMFKDG